MGTKRQSASCWLLRWHRHRNLGDIKQKTSWGVLVLGRRPVGRGCRNPVVGRINNNIRLIEITAAEERPRDIRQHGWWHVPVPGKPCAGQRLFISGRRKVNARTRRGGLVRNRNPIGAAGRRRSSTAHRLANRSTAAAAALSRARCQWWAILISEELEPTVTC